MRLRNFIHLTLLVVFVAVFGTKTRAQQYDLQTFGTESGIAGLQINDIAQDELGYLWVATNKGVSRFDGKKFVNYDQKHGLSENSCNTIFCGSNNRVWIGHRSGGVSIIHNDSIQIITETHGLINNEVHDIFHDAEGNIWVATFGGVSIFDGENWLSKTTAEGLTSNNIQAIAQDNEGNIWLGTFGAGINILKEKEVTHLHRGNGLANNHVTGLLRKNGQMFISTLGGLSIWKDGHFENNSAANGIINNQINQVSINQNNDVWLATFNGVSRIRNGNLLSFTEENGLPDNEVLSGFNDSTGNTWLGTRKGLVKVQNLEFAHYFSTEDLDVEPSFIYRDSKNRLWAANQAGGVLQFDGYQFQLAFEDPDINDHQISSITEDGDGNLWFGTMDFGGLFQWDEKKLYIYSDEFGLADNNINCLLQDADGSILIGTPNGLSRFNGMDFEPIYVSEEMSSNHITALEIDANGTVLIGAVDGTVFSLREGEIRTNLGFNASSAITDIYPGTFGNMFTTESDGLYLQKGGKINHFGEENGLHVSLNSVAQLGKYMYLGTDRGMQRVSIQNDSLAILSFGKNDGFLGGACTKGAMLLDKDVLWLGTENGVSQFSPEEVRENRTAPKTFLTDLQLFYRKVNWKEMGFDVAKNGLPQALKLPYTENYFRFHFKGLDHTDPQHVAYKWKLEGFETDWSPYSDQELANYPNLPPGTYTFMLLACNSAGICNAEPVTFQFIISPPFWQTIWFYVLLITAFSAITYLYIKRRERNLLEEKQVLESTVEERTKELREQKEIVEHQNHHITEGIEYAKNIQMAILPSEEEMNRAFNGHFIFYRPKETVGGDFYWVYSKGDVSWAAAVDCTGHGVSGAFMSMIGSELLNQIIVVKQEQDPATVLLEMDKGIKLAFAQSAKEFESDQGMDVSLVKINRKKQTVSFAGALRPLYVVSENELSETDGDRFAISCGDDEEKQFNTYTFDVKKKTMLYLFSDGFADQFGGSKGKKFMTKRLKELLLKNAHLGMEEQKKSVQQTFDGWKGKEFPQIDDILMMGIEL